MAEDKEHNIIDYYLKECNPEGGMELMFEEEMKNLGIEVGKDKLRKSD